MDLNLGQLNTFRLTLFALVLALMGILETVWAVREWKTARWKRWVFHGALTVFNTVLTRLAALGPLLIWLEYVRNQGWGLSQKFGLTGMAEVITTFILFDLFDYWWHRWNHTVPFLWRFHKPHHIDTHVDVTTSLRFHPGELFLSYGMKAIWILIWGPSLAGFMIFEAGITAYSQFHHSNIDLPDTWEKGLRWIHMTPRLHAGHHTVSLRTRSANYSTIFLIWDRIFGTLKEPDSVEMRELGLLEGRKTYLSPLDFIKAPFVSAEEVRLL